MKSLFTANLLFIFLSLSCQHSEQSVVYEVGFRTIKAMDSSRIYKTDSDKKHYLYYRPLDIDVWYPAVSSNHDSLLAFGDFLRLFEERANYYTDSRAGDGLAEQFSKNFSELFKCSTSEKILAHQTRTLKNASEQSGKFPLVLYLSSYNGMGYENVSLLETLARNGYVVAAISSIGRYPGDMTMQLPDLMEQVNDAAFSLQLLEKLPNVDAGKICVIGYSWGGLAGAVLTANEPEIDGLISLDGSEFHHYGSEKDEDIDFDKIVNSPVLKRKRISVPYLRLESHSPENQTTKDSIYAFSNQLNGKVEIYKVLHSSHQDFSSFPSVVKTSGGCNTNNVYATITGLVLGYCNQLLKSTPAQVFADSIQAQSGKTIQPVLQSSAK